MSDDIVTKAGKIVGQWDGRDAGDLKTELARVKQELRKAGSTDKVEVTGVPHRDQFPDDLKDFTPYLLWGCDKNNVCLVGSGANRLESVASIRDFYANDIAKDALARSRD